MVSAVGTATHYPAAKTNTRGTVLQLELAGVTDVGITRRGRANQDAFFVPAESADTDDGTLVVVADGMGGAAAGELASATAIEALREFDFGSDPGQELPRAFSVANRDVHDFASSNPEHRGAGTTLVGAYLKGSDLWVGNVGDSRAYRCRDGRLEQLTIDHSFVQEEIDAGRITEIEARIHPRRNIITRNIGSQPEVDTDITRWDVRPGDVLLLCSDGLWGPLEDERLQHILERNRSRPHQAAEALVAAANESGGPDNVTAVVVRVGDGDAGGSSPLSAPATATSGRGRLFAVGAVLAAAAVAIAVKLALG